MSSLRTDPGTQVPRVRSSARRAQSTAHSSTRNATLTIAGVMYILVTLFLAVGAINAQNNLLFWLFGFAIALLVTSGILSGNAMLRLNAHAFPGENARAGRIHILRYRIRSHSRLFPLFALIIREEETGLQTESPGIVVHLAPGSSGESSAEVVAHTRGRYTLPAFRIESTFPFGIIRKWIRFEQPRTLVVLPYALPLRPAPLLFQPGARAEDHHSKPRRGSGTEFFGLRSYSPGDPRRKIAWKTSARRDGLVVIQHAQETEPRIVVWLRKPNDFDPPALVERAIALASSVSRAAVDSGYTVGFWAPWSSLRFSPSAPGHSQLMRIDTALANLDLSLDAQPDTPPPSMLGSVIQVVCQADMLGGLSDGYLAADRPESWLMEGESLPDALTIEAGTNA
ncbi:MAG: DUF58 domain-containing protein [Phycisphaerales bacterium]|nr:DUF58 domain-containing protein [Phycisphaerales bacterium]